MVNTIPLEKAIGEYGRCPSLAILYSIGIELVDVKEEIRVMDEATDRDIERQRMDKAESFQYEPTQERGAELCEKVDFKAMVRKHLGIAD